MGGGIEQEWRKGPWTPLEDKLLIEYISQNGEGRWSSVSKCTGLNRSGKSCRLRWVNYLRPGLKKGHLTPQEEGVIIELHALWGNKWSTIARYLPGRTDNEIKNYWRTHFKKNKPCDQMKQEKKRKMLKLQKQEEMLMESSDDHSKVDVVTNESVDEKNSKRFEVEIEFPGMDNGNDQVLPMINQETASDIIPFDCYLWGGLWPTIYDDHDPIGCNKGGLIDQTKGNFTDYYCSNFQGDAVDYVHNGGFIF